MTPRGGDRHRYVALLRAINVGGHTVRMERLRALFEALGFDAVETFIASGNVLFDATSTDAAALERGIGAHLERELGYPVATFLRTPAELADIASFRPPSHREGSESGLAIAFLHEHPGPEARDKLLALRTEVDDFHFQGRELYWTHGGRMSDSAFSGAVLEKILRAPATIRNATTVRKLAAKCGGGTVTPT